MSDPFTEFGGEVEHDPFSEFGGEVETKSTPEKVEKSLIGDIKSFFSSPSLDKLKTLGDDSPAASALHGGLKGAYFGLDDSIVGALGGDKESYKSKQERLEELNPTSFLAGELGSGFVTPTGAGILLKTKQLAKLAETSPRLAAALAKVGMGAAEGGTAGIGYSDGDLESGAVGALIGGAVPGVLGLGGKIGSMAPSRRTVVKALGGLDDLEYDVSAAKDLSTTKTTKQMDKLYKDALKATGDRVKAKGLDADNALGKYSDLVDYPRVSGVPDATILPTENLQPGLVKQFSRPNSIPSDPLQGSKKLDAITPGTIPANEINQLTDSYIKGNLMEWKPKTQTFDYKSKDAERAGKVIIEQTERTLSGMADDIPEDRVRGLVKSMRDSVNYDKDPKGVTSNIMGFGAELNSLLKKNNPEFARLGLKTQKAIQLDNDAKKMLGATKEWSGDESFLTTSDRTKAIEKRLLDEGKVATGSFARRLKGATGIDLEDEAMKKAVLDSTGGGAPTNFLERMGIQKGYGAVVSPISLGTAGGAYGYAEGGTAGGGAGVAVGMLAGLTRQKYGKKLSRDFLQSQLAKNPNNPYALQSRLSKAQKNHLIDAYISRGNPGLAATYYKLSQTDPEVRKKEGEQE